MRYLIDGYNLLHAVEVRTKHAGPHGLESARNRLLDRLRRGHGDASSDLTVVFDAAHAPPGVSARHDYHGITVLFTVGGQADDLIEELVRRDPTPRQLTVVSSDRRVQEAARRRACPVLDCLDYLEHLLARPESPPPAVAADGPAKPEGVSGAEARRWLAEFGDLDQDPGLREWFEMNPPPEDGE